MSTTLDALVQELSKQLDDYWRSTTTSEHATTPTYALVDTALCEKQSDWVSNGSSGDTPSTVYIATAGGAAPEGQERVVNTLTIGSGTLTTTTARPFTAKIESGDTYEIHRLFTRAEKERAIQYACYSSFPNLYKKISDESIRFGSWIRDGGFIVWPTTSTLTYWAKSGTTTLTQTITKPNIYREGRTSCGLSGAVGYIYQSPTENPDLIFLAGKTPTVKIRARTGAASQIRLAIYDGATTTYSSYHAGDSSWGDITDPIYVSATIPDNPSTVQIRVYYDSVASPAYIDEVWIEGVGEHYTYDISGLGLYQNQPSQVLQILDDQYARSDFVRLHNWESPTVDGKLRFRGRTMPADGSLLRITGMGYLSSPTTAAGTTEADAPQTQIIVAESAVYLYDLLINKSPAQDIGRFEAAKQRWTQLSMQRRIQFGMPQPAGTLIY